ncbi:MAG: hypothetical protein U9Q97_04945 [Acidobacteriota bacterium]|nr:hypothetical protein [Acidobacteriota bacterium]
MSSKVECLFGFHKYTIPWKKDSNVLICENCKRVGYRKNSNGGVTWYDLDEKGNMIHCKDSIGFEVWYDKEGNEIHCKNSYGYESWYDGSEWVDKKPKNWKYEKCLNDLTQKFGIVK